MTTDHPSKHCSDCQRYRARIHQLASERDKKRAPLERQLARFERGEKWAREWLDPEKRQTMYSMNDVTTSHLIAEHLIKLRAEVVGERLTCIGITECNKHYLADLDNMGGNKLLIAIIKVMSKAYFRLGKWYYERLTAIWRELWYKNRS